MSLSGGNAGYLDIKNAILRVGTLDVQTIVSGVDTATNIAKTNPVLLWDDQGADLNAPPLTLSSATRSTSPPYIQLNGGFGYVGIKLPNAWLGAFDVYMSDKTDGSIKLHTYTTDTTSYGDTGYELVLNNSGVTLNYDGTQVATASYTWTNDTWTRVVVGFERGAWTVSVGGAVVLVKDDTERTAVYANVGQYLRFDAASATTTKRVRYINFFANGHWLQSNVGTLSYTQGNVVIGGQTTNYKLDVVGDAHFSNIYQNDQKLYAQRRWEIDLSGQSTDNFYPVIFYHNHNESANYGEYPPVNFKVFGKSLGGDNAYNECTLIGYYRGGGYSDHHYIFDVHEKRYDASEKRYLGVYQGTQSFAEGFAIYMRGGYYYSTLTDAVDVTVHTSAVTKNNSVFAIKDNTDADVSGTSANIVKRVDIYSASGVGNRWTSGDLRLEAGSNLVVDTNTLYVDGVNNRVGIGSTIPTGPEKLQIAGSIGVGTNNGDYQHIRLGGGNSSGYLYGSYPGHGDNINLSYNYYHDGSSNQWKNALGKAARLAVGYGTIDMYTTGSTSTVPTLRVHVDETGHVGINSYASFGNNSKFTIFKGDNDEITNKIHMCLSTSNVDAHAAGFLGPGIEFRQRWWSGGGSPEVTGAIHGIKTAANGASGGGLAFRTFEENVGMGTKMVLHDTGNLGLGTTDPQYLLDVRGTANCNALYVQNKLAYTDRYWEIDLTSSSTGNFYPVRLTHKIPASSSTPCMDPVRFHVFGVSLGDGDSYNECTLIGYGRSGGQSDHRVFFKVHERRYSGSERRFLGIYTGTYDFAGFVIYMRGGYKYGVITDASSVTAYTSALTISSTIYDISASGTSVNIAPQYRSEINMGSMADMEYTTATQLPKAGIRLQALTNASTRPSLTTGSGQGEYEIRGISASGEGADDGFLRLRAGGGTSSTNAVYIDMSGYSQVADMAHSMVFGVNGVERMRIANGGDVGIGTTLPGSKLAIYEYQDSPGTNTLVAGTTDERVGISWKNNLNSYYASNELWLVYSTGNFGNGPITTARIFYEPRSYNEVSSGAAGVHGILNFGVGYTEDTAKVPTLTITSKPQVGINDETPGYMLDVNGSFRAYGVTDSNSDRRIKNNVVDVNDESALDIVRLLKPKKYDYIDKEGRSTASTVWGFIAQEVRAILPYATGIINDFVPDVYQYANVVHSNIISFTNFNTSQLKNAKQLRVNAKHGNKKVVTIRDIIDESHIQVVENLDNMTGSWDEDGKLRIEYVTETLTREEYENVSDEDKSNYTTIISSYYLDNESNTISVDEFNALEPGEAKKYSANIDGYTRMKEVYPGDSLFVFGQKVSDFHTLRKEALWTVSMAALQEVDRQLQNEKVKISKIENDVKGVIRRVKDVSYDKVNERGGLLVTADGSLTNKINDKAVLGVIGETNPEAKNNETLIKTSGEALVWVVNDGASNIEVGDLVTTSNITGYARVQDDDLVRSYTVGKVLEVCDFNPQDVWVQKIETRTANVTYYYKTTTISQEEYSNLVAEERFTRDETYYLKTTDKQVFFNNYINKMPSYDFVKYFKTQTYTINEETYNALNDDEKRNYSINDEGTYTYSCEIFLTPEVYTSLGEDEQNTYTKGYFRYVYDEKSEPTDGYLEKHRTRYFRILDTSTNPTDVDQFDYIEVTKEEKVPVLDVNGQYKYVDTPESKPRYEIRYLDINGAITTRHNEVHRAALLKVLLN